MALVPVTLKEIRFRAKGHIAPASRREVSSGVRNPRVAITNSVRAEAELCGDVASHRVLDELPVACGTEIVPLTLVDLAAETVAFGIVSILEDLIDFHQMVAFVVQVGGIHWLDDRFDF